jgi:23S rRNA pseudouridine2604 synthase
MADTPRKTLGLPKNIERDDGATGNLRRPLRSGAPKPRAKAPGEVRDGKTLGGIPAVQQKPRGTPSRAPVVPKDRVPAAAASATDKVPQSGVRISKLMAERGLCSRREADGYIERGWVFVNGERVTELGTRADPLAIIKLDKGARAAQLQQMTILLHKPVGYVSGQPEPGFTPAVTLVQPETQYQVPGTPLFHASHLKGLAPAGRLDIDSTGLLVLTQDGRVARQLIGENSSVDKEYLVRVEGRLDARGLALLNHGLSLDGKELKPAKVEWLNEDQLRFELVEGRKRQIRRMCELVGLKVVGLKRVRIGKVKLSDLPLGQWRFLRDDEAF